MEKRLIASALVVLLIVLLANTFDIQSWFTQQKQVATPDNPSTSTISTDEANQNYVDYLWIGETHAYMNVLSDDSNMTASNNTTIEQFNVFHRDLNLALHDNDLFTVSPKYQHAQSEWRLGLVDLNDSISKTIDYRMAKKNNVTMNITEYNVTREDIYNEYNTGATHVDNFTAEMNGYIINGV